MQTLILMDKKSNIIKKITREHPHSTVISMNFEVDNYLKAQNIHFVSIQDYGPDFKEIDKDAIWWIKRWSNKELYNTKNIKELLDYENLSLWWLMEPWLYDSYVYYDSLENILRSIRIFSIIFEKESLEKLIVISDNSLYQKIAKKLTEKGNIPYIYYGTRVHLLGTLKQFIKKITIDHYIKMIYTLRKIIWLFFVSSNRAAKNEPNSNQTKILFFSNGPYTKCKTLNNETKNGDPYIITIIDELIKNKKNYIKTIDVTENFKLNYGVLKEESKDRIMNFEVLENYRTREINKKVKILNHYYKNQWNILRKNNQVKASFEYNGINIFDIVEPQFSCYFSIRLYGHLLNLELIKELIKKENPEIIVFPAETSEFARSLFHVCRKTNIKSVAIQHGIFENTIRCMYLKEDISLGTAGPLSLLPVKSEYPIIVLNGDLVTQVNIHQMLEFHNDNKFSATMGVKPYNVEIPYGIIKCENNRLMEILEKPMLNYLINAGIYVLNPNIFSFIPSNTLFSMDKLFETLINHDCSVGTYIIEEDWTDVGRHDEYKKVNGII